MKKQIILGLMLIGIGHCLHAQWSVGARGGVNWVTVDAKNIPLASPNDKFSTDFNFLQQYTITVKRNIGKNLSILLQPSYTERGAKAETLQNYTNPTATSFTQSTVQYNYLELPILCSYELPLTSKLFLIGSAGPYVGYMVSGKVKMVIESQFAGFPSEREEFNEKLDFATAEINRWDIGLMASAGIGFKVFHGSLIVDARYNRGLLNLNTEANTASGFNYGFGLGLGYLYQIGEADY